MLSYSQFIPPEDLRPFVSLIWSVQSLCPKSQDLGRRVLFPDGHVEMMFNYFPEGIIATSGDLFTTNYPAIMWGPQTRPFQIIPHLKTVYSIAVRLQPGVAHHLLGDRISHICNAFVRLDDLSRDFDTTVQMLFADEPFDTKQNLAILIERLRALFRDCPLPSQTAALASVVAARDGAVHVEELAGISGLSRQSLARKFKDQVGMSPKKFAMVQRLAAILDQVEPGQPNPWLELALTHGFADQAHFCNSFKRVVGMTPTQFDRTSFDAFHFFNQYGPN